MRKTMTENPYVAKESQFRRGSSILPVNGGEASMEEEEEAGDTIELEEEDGTFDR